MMIRVAFGHSYKRAQSALGGPWFSAPFLWPWYKDSHLWPWGKTQQTDT